MVVYVPSSVHATIPKAQMTASQPASMHRWMGFIVVRKVMPATDCQQYTYDYRFARPVVGSLEFKVEKLN